MKLIIDISKDRYDEIMSMDWKNCRLLFDEEIRAIHDGKALEQEPCDDAISRSAVLDLPRIKTHNVWGNVIYESVDVENVRRLPSVTPQPKIGKWIMSDDGLYRPICNNCGAHPWKGYIPTVEEATEAFKYCPHCGCAHEMAIKAVDDEIKEKSKADFMALCTDESSSEKPKIGHWEWNQYDANPKIGNFHCSLCHSIGRTYFDYCPYCGANMSEIQTGAEGSEKND